LDEKEYDEEFHRMSDQLKAVIEDFVQRNGLHGYYVTLVIHHDEEGICSTYEGSQKMIPGVIATFLHNKFHEVEQRASLLDTFEGLKATLEFEGTRQQGCINAVYVGIKQTLGTPKLITHRLLRDEVVANMQMHDVPIDFDTFAEDLKMFETYAEDQVIDELVTHIGKTANGKIMSEQEMMHKALNMAARSVNDLHLDIPPEQLTQRLFLAINPKSKELM